MRKLLFPIAFLALFNSCSEGSENFESNAGYSELNDLITEIATTEDYTKYDEGDDNYNLDRKEVPSDLTETQPKIIKSGSVEFQTDSLTNTKSRIDQIVKELNGYYSSEDETHYTYKDQLYLTIRVPAKNFEALINKIGEGVDHFDSKNISAQDVTEEFIDLSARVKTKKETEQRYRDLLQKANTVSEILEIEEQISYLRADIESLEGRLKYLNNRVGFSSLIVTCYVEIPGGPRQGYAHKFGNGFENGWDGFVLFFVGLTNLWPFLIIGIIVWFFVRRAIKKRRARKISLKTSNQPIK
ncbi:MAG: hypothetical protein ACI9J3_002128 [Parvicellaceae bacterium]|jgi:hypothetical protein